MEYGPGQMELLGLQQKAEMTAQGMTPEQAQMHSETPHPDDRRSSPERPSRPQTQAAGQPTSRRPRTRTQDRSTSGRRRRCSSEDKTADRRAHAREGEDAARRTRWPTGSTSGTKEQLRLKDRSAANERQAEAPAAEGRGQEAGQPPAEEGRAAGEEDRRRSRRRRRRDADVPYKSGQAAPVPARPAPGDRGEVGRARSRGKKKVSTRAAKRR